MTETKPNPIDARCAELGITRNVLAARMADQTGWALNSCLGTITEFAFGRSGRPSQFAAVARAADCSADSLLGLPTASRDYEKLEGKLQTALRRVQELEAANESIAGQLQLEREDAVALGIELIATVSRVEEVRQLTAGQLTQLRADHEAAGKAHAATVAELEGRIAGMVNREAVAIERKERRAQLHRIAAVLGVATETGTKVSFDDEAIADSCLEQIAELERKFHAAEVNHESSNKERDRHLRLKPMTLDEVGAVYSRIYAKDSTKVVWSRWSETTRRDYTDLVNACRVGIAPAVERDPAGNRELTYEQKSKLNGLATRWSNAKSLDSQKQWEALCSFVAGLMLANPDYERTKKFLTEAFPDGFTTVSGRVGQLIAELKSSRVRGEGWRALSKVDATAHCREIAERLVFALLIYPDHKLQERGPTGCIHDALHGIDREVGTMVREQGARFAYAHFWPESDDDELPEPAVTITAG